VTAVKGATAYLGAATAVVEVILAVEALAAGVVPPVARLHEPRRGSRFVRDAPAALPIGVAPTALCLSWSWAGSAPPSSFAGGPGVASPAAVRT